MAAQTDQRKKQKKQVNWSKYWCKIPPQKKRTKESSKTLSFYEELGSVI